MININEQKLKLQKTTEAIENLEKVIDFLEFARVLDKGLMERDLIRLNVVLNLMRGQKQSLEFTVKRFGEG